MAMASWMFRGRSIRSGRTFRSRHDGEEEIQLDLSKGTYENAKEILLNICKKQGLTEGRKFGYLNAFVKLLSKAKGIENTGYTVEQLLCCLRVALVHDASQVRAAALRVVRYLLKNESDVKCVYDLKYQYLISRSLDVNFHNDAERMQALRLIRRMLLLAPSMFAPGLVRSLVAVANGAGEEKDRMLRVCLAALSEICVLNTEEFIGCGGVTVVQRNLLDCSMPRIAESLCGVLLFLLNNPVSRAKAGVQLQALAAPFCDFHWEPSRNRDEREVKFHCSRLALLSVLRSWPGVLHFCHPGDSSGLRALVNILYVRQLEVRKAVLDLLYELLGLPQPEWTDEFSVALEAVDPSHPRDAWRLSEGFVAAEGCSILPNLAMNRPNLVEIHLALLLYIFLEVGLLEAIAEVIVTSDTFISVRATVLLGELLHLIHLLLPPECCNLTPPLPTLLSKAADASDPATQNQALAAVAALAQLHAMLKRQPAPASLFLDQLLQCGTWGVQSRSGAFTANIVVSDGGGAAGSNTSSVNSSSRSKSEKNKLYQLMLKDSDDMLRDSMVLSNKDGFSWNWNVVRAILKNRNDALKRLEDSNYKTFIRRLVQYFKPSSNRFSRVELSSRQQMNIYTLAGFELIDCLLDADEPEGQKMLSELLADIWVQVDAITSSRSAHDCLFSPQHMTNSLCQDYFLFIGRLCHTARGLRILDKAGILQQLLNLVIATNHECYVKLVVAGLDYSLDSMPRIILSKVLTAGVEASRLYATQHMLVLLRARLPDFHKWGIELLVMQLYDPSRNVSSTALNILSEAVEIKACLDAVVSLRPSLLHLGDKGLLLLIRFLSISTGFSFLQDAGFVTTQLERWANSFNYRYVRLVEGELHDSLTLHQRGADGRYSQRVTSARHDVKDVLVPPHLYGQLVQHEAGLSVLKQNAYIHKLFSVIRDGVCDKESEILEMKAALWAVGHIGTSGPGATLLQQADILIHIVQHAESATVYSVRATAFYVLGLLATTLVGASLLSKYGWLSVRHDRHDRWPVIEDKFDPDDINIQTSTVVDDAASVSSGGGFGPSLEAWDLEPGGENSENHTFYLVADEESGNEDEEMLLDDSATFPSPWTQTDIPINTAQSAGSGSISGSGIGIGIGIPGRKQSPSQHKSATLPHWRPGMPPQRHMRSYSESKQLPPQIIVGSDSVTSGDWTRRLSQASDHVPTLSPIPSSASLYTVQSGVMIRRASQISQRKCSVSTYGSVASEGTHSSPLEAIVANSVSRLSQQDLLGYATLRSLNRHKRPLLSESSNGKTDDLLIFDDSFPLSPSISGSAASSFSSSSRALKARSLDRHFSHPRLSDHAGIAPVFLTDEYHSAVAGTKTQAGSLVPFGNAGSKENREDGNSPCYLGICLPQQLMVLFPEEVTHVQVPIHRQGSASFSELEQLPEADQEADPSSSSDSDDDDDDDDDDDGDDHECGRPDNENIKIKSKRLHTISTCLICCQSAERDRKISTSSSNRYRTDTESSQGGMESPIPFPSRNKSQSLSSGGIETLPGNTPSGSMDSGHSFNALGRGDSSVYSPSQRYIRREILKYVSRMSNPVWAKVSKQALLQLKQKYGSVFQDVCLYSAVSQLLASCSYRLVARRFIQELFLDLNFDMIYDAAMNIVQTQQQVPPMTEKPSPFTAVSPKISVISGIPVSSDNIVICQTSVPTVSALSMKLASVISQPTTSGNLKDSPIVSPSEEESTLENQKGSLVDSFVTRPHGSDPVPISGSKSSSISAGYMIRSPPLEVVKEETVVSVLNSEFQSPVDSGSVTSNGQVDEDYIAFLNQPFDDIPMIDEVKPKSDSALKSEPYNIVKETNNSDRNHFNVLQSCTDKFSLSHHPCKSVSSEAQKCHVVSKEISFKPYMTALVDKKKIKQDVTSHISVVSSSPLLEQISSPNVPYDLLAKSSSSGLNKTNFSVTRDSSAASSTSFVTANNNDNIFDSRSSISSFSDMHSSFSYEPLQAMTDRNPCSNLELPRHHSSTPSPVSGRQRKTATTSAPDIASLQERSVPISSRNSKVPRSTSKTSKEKR